MDKEISNRNWRYFRGITVEISEQMFNFWLYFYGTIEEILIKNYPEESSMQLLNQYQKALSQEKRRRVSMEFSKTPKESEG